jgi:hypothetical protein
MREEYIKCPVELNAVPKRFYCPDEPNCEVCKRRKLFEEQKMGETKSKKPKKGKKKAEPTENEEKRYFRLKYEYIHRIPGLAKYHKLMCKRQPIPATLKHLYEPYELHWRAFVRKFDEWYADKKKERQRLVPVRDYSETFPALFDAYQWHLSKKGKLTYEEMRDFFIRELTEPESITLRIKFNEGFTVKELMKKAQELVSSKREQFGNQVDYDGLNSRYETDNSLSWWINLYRPSSEFKGKGSVRVYLDEIERYGRHYDEKNGGIKHDYNDREYIRDIQNANKIIENLKRGEFPGKY